MKWEKHLGASRALETVVSDRADHTDDLPRDVGGDLRQHHRTAEWVDSLQESLDEEADWKEYEAEKKRKKGRRGG